MSRRAYFNCTWISSDTHNNKIQYMNQNAHIKQFTEPDGLTSYAVRRYCVSGMRLARNVFAKNKKKTTFK